MPRYYVTLHAKIKLDESYVVYDKYIHYIPLLKVDDKLFSAWSWNCSIVVNCYAYRCKVLYVSEIAVFPWYTFYPLQKYPMANLYHFCALQPSYILGLPWTSCFIDPLLSCLLSSRSQICPWVTEWVAATLLKFMEV